MRIDGRERVTIEGPGTSPETVANTVADEDVVARKVAESVRARLLAEAGSAGAASDARPAVAAGMPVEANEPPRRPMSEAASPPRFVLGVEHVPLVRLRFGSGGSPALRAGTADAENYGPTMPRLALDVVVVRKLTLGVAATVAYVERDRGGSVTTISSPQNIIVNQSVSSFEVAVAPRVGALLQITRTIAFWPRAGVSWLYASQPASSVRYDAAGEPFVDPRPPRPEHRLGLDVDAFALWTPLARVGVIVGPTLALPLAESARGSASV
ncbi:MAG TPA: hypothetical protein VM925_34830, partial [Labilithrix sp.]|nr:hypothetical protein [Labilithrix sp.]